MLPILLLLAVLAYLPGFTGGFYFDDYVQIILNDGIHLEFLDWRQLSQAAGSSNAGPLGRPLPMASFALEGYFWGVVPHHFKLVNLAIHLANGVLVYALFSRIFTMVFGDQDSRSGEVGRLWGLMLTAWWLFHPLNVTSVLYVVQRMTSLSAFFSLLGLIGYIHFREKTLISGRFGTLWLGIACLATGTLLSAYCKENGLLTPALAWLIEILIFRCHMHSPRATRYLRLACVLLPIVCLMGVIEYFSVRPNWSQTAYAGRPFTLEERLLTEARIVWFYIRQLIIPLSSAFSLYLDEFSLSQGLFQPWTTALAIVGHLALGGGAFFLRRRLPLVTLGIAWFYFGHALESSIIPLELAYEHRNYLPGLGILLAMIALIRQLMPQYKRLVVAIVATLAALCLFITTQRSIAMGDAFLYPVFDAERHPASARANFDAGRTLALAIEQHPELASEYYPRAMAYFDRSIRADEQALAPFTGLLGLWYVAAKQADQGSLQMFEQRLRKGVPPHSTVMICRALTSHLALDRPVLSYEEGERLYQAALSNPRLKGPSRAIWQSGYAMFVSNVLKDAGRGLQLMEQAIEVSPFNAELKVLAVAMLIDQGRLEEASILLDKAGRDNRKGYFDKPISGLRQIIDARKNGQHESAR